MSPQLAMPVKPGSWPITVGAAGIAAAQFARCGFDVMIQQGHDKPWYDLVVTKAGNLLKIGVKASENGRWRLAESYLQRAAQVKGQKPDIHHAIRMWLDTHGERTVYCLVQFEDVPLNQMPRIYLATPAEIALRMRQSAERVDEPILFEQYEWTSPDTGFTAFETLPSSWFFSLDRIQELLSPQQTITAEPASPRGMRPNPGLRPVAVMTA